MNVGLLGLAVLGYAVVLGLVDIRKELAGIREELARLRKMVP